MVTHLDEAQIRAALDWDALIEAMERALTAFSGGGSFSRCAQC
jgi:hypothetical protein